MKIALYKSMEFSFEHNAVFEINKGNIDGFSSYIRVSEIVDVEFPPLTDDVQIQGALRALDNVEKEARNDLERKLVDIREKRANLMALTHTQMRHEQQDEPKRPRTWAEQASDDAGVPCSGPID